MAAVGTGAPVRYYPSFHGGALALAAMGANLRDFDKERKQGLCQLFIMAAVGLLITAVVSALFYNPIANLMMG